MSIDWTKKTTPEQREAQRLEDWRASTTRSRLQIADALVALEILTEEEAEEFCGHSLPVPLDTLSNELPNGIRQKSRRLLRGASQFDRNHPMWEHAPNPPYDETTIDLIFGYDENLTDSD